MDAGSCCVCCQWKMIQDWLIIRQIVDGLDCVKQPYIISKIYFRRKEAQMQILWIILHTEQYTWKTH